METLSRTFQEMTLTEQRIMKFIVHRVPGYTDSCTEPNDKFHIYPDRDENDDGAHSDICVDRMPAFDVTDD